MNEQSQAPYGIDKGCGCGCDSFMCVLGLLFGCYQKASRSMGRCCRPSTEYLPEARGGRAGVRRAHYGCHDSNTMKSMTSRRRTAVQRAQEGIRFDTACGNSCIRRLCL